MVMETIDKVVGALGAGDIDARLEELLVDGILYAFQEQVRAALRCAVLRCVPVRAVALDAELRACARFVLVCARPGACIPPPPRWP
jgi:hypothetical protein